MEKTFFISGIGGQGVQVLCKVLATVVDECGMNMCLFPWYQGQRRGGATFGRLIGSSFPTNVWERRKSGTTMSAYTLTRRLCGIMRINAGKAVLSSSTPTSWSFRILTT